LEFKGPVKQKQGKLNGKNNKEKVFKDLFYIILKIMMIILSDIL